MLFFINATVCGRTAPDLLQQLQKQPEKTESFKKKSEKKIRLEDTPNRRTEVMIQTPKQITSPATREHNPLHERSARLASRAARKTPLFFANFFVQCTI